MLTLLPILKEVEQNLLELLETSELHTLYIDYHKPYVRRIWFQYQEYRVYLHQIEPTEETEALYHPHPWDSIIRIIRGSYEMGVGHSMDQTVPKSDCKLILPSGSVYEMTEPNGWHYVSPQEPIWSLMITGNRNNRQMPVEPHKTFRTLTENETNEILDLVKSVYTLNKKLNDL